MISLLGPQADTMPSHRILVVDDEEGVRQLVHDQLTRLGYDVHLAAHGEEAIERFGQVAPHLVLLDFLVPRKNGFGVAEAIRQHALGESVPIVMMSGVFKNPKTAVEAREKYQVLEFLSKPLDGGRIETLIQEALRDVVPDELPAQASEAPTPPPLVRATPASQARPAPSIPPAQTGSGGAALQASSVDRRPPTTERPAPRGATAPARPSTKRALPEEAIVDGRYVARPLPVPNEGEIADMPVAQLLAALYYDRSTGMADLTNNGIHRRVYVIEGRPTFMQSNAERENVGSLLLRRGRITEQDFQRCRKFMKERRRTLQKSLLELRLVNETELGTAYKLLAGQLLPLALGMSSGQYQWQETDAFVGRVPEGRFDPLEVLFRGIARNVHPPQIFSFFKGREDVPIFPAQQWEALREAFLRAFPSGTALLERINGSQTFRTLTRGEDEVSVIMPPLYALTTTGMAVVPHADELGMEAAVHAAAAQVAFADDGSIDLGLDSGVVDGDAREAVLRFHDDVMSKNFFEILGVTKDTPIEGVKSAYFTIVKKWHVDAFAGRELGDAQEKLEAGFARVSEAYETITDEGQRAEYLTFLDRKSKGLPTDVAEILRGENLYDQALAMERRRDYRGAREVLEEAVRLNPDPLYFATLGWVVYAASPNDDRAVSAGVHHIKRALKEQENLPLAYQYLGTIAFRRNQPGEAKKWWTRCLEWEADNIEASRGLRMINQRNGAGNRSGIFDRLRGKKDG